MIILFYINLLDRHLMRFDFMIDPDLWKEKKFLHNIIYILNTANVTEYIWEKPF